MRPIAALFALALTSCALSDAGTSPQQASNVTGGIGSYASTKSGTGAPGGINGGVLANAIGSTLDERDRQRAYDAEVQALEQGEPGEPVGWRGHVPGRHGTIVPGVNYETKGVRCRDYSHTIFIDGKPQIARASACRNPDGTWSPVG